jgi:hypothetical protein
MLKTQTQMFYDAHKKTAEGNELFMEMIKHPTNPLTNQDLERLIKRRPDKWKRFEGFLGKLTNEVFQDD